MDQMNRRTNWLAVVAAPLFALAIAAASEAAEVSTGSTCPSDPVDPQTISEQASSLKTLGPTLAILADDYDKKAEESTKLADRYRTWASAEDMFGGTTYGKRYAAIYFADEANALDAEAAQSRALAAKYRGLAKTAESSNGC